MLRTLPDTIYRTQQELDLQTILGLVLIASTGYASPDVERVYAQARALCQRVGERFSYFQCSEGHGCFISIAGELQRTRLGEQLLRLAQREHDALPLFVAHVAMGTLFMRGELVLARAHFEQSSPSMICSSDRSLAFRLGL